MSSAAFLIDNARNSFDFLEEAWSLSLNPSDKVWFFHDIYERWVPGIVVGYFGPAKDRGVLVCSAEFAAEGIFNHETVSIGKSKSCMIKPDSHTVRRLLVLSGRYNALEVEMMSKYFDRAVHHAWNRRKLRQPIESHAQIAMLDVY